MLRTIAGLGTVLGVGAWAGNGWDRQGPASGAGGTLDRAVQAISQGVQDASATVGEGITQAQTSARKLGLVQQIEARLHQDKAVEADRIEVVVEEEGTALLKGLVPDRACKDKAVALTRDTRGVAKVIDQLAVVPAPRVITAPPADDDPTPAVADRPRTFR